MPIGYVGLGKMGRAQVARLIEKGHSVVVWNRSASPRRAATRIGATAVESLEALAERLPSPRVIWLMVSHGAVESVFSQLLPHLRRGDIIVDGGNSHFRETILRASRAAKRGVAYLDVGVSGGPSGARKGACIMVGGDVRVFRRIEKLLRDLAAPRAYMHVGASGAGHFAKMVHNGIEYGMMQAIAEGFSVLRRSKYRYNLGSLARLYNNRSVIESRLVGWLQDLYRVFGNELRDVSGSVAHTGEGKWTVEVARALGVPARVIEDSYRIRIASKRSPSYTGKIVSALRNRFGGHDVAHRA